MTTHLSGPEAAARAEAVLRRLWPGWSGDLEPLKPLGKPLRATPFRATGGPERVVIKVWGPGNAEKAAAQAARQSAVAEAMASGPCRAVRVLVYDADSCALVMQDAGGPDLRAALNDATPETVEALLRRAGAWLAAFHALSLRPAKCRPAGHVAWARRLAGEVEDGTRPVAEPDRFLETAARLETLGAAARGLPSPRAVTHRDLTLSNLVLGADGTLWGIDFESDREDDPLRDRVSLALDALAFARCEPHRALAALRDGWGPSGAAPKVTLFFQRAFALGVLARTPPIPSRRQAALRAAAEWLLTRDNAVL